MDWSEYKFRLPSEYTERASDIINLCLDCGMYIEDYSDMEQIAPTIRRVDYYSEKLLKKDKAHSVIHIYMEESENPQESVKEIEDRLSLAGIPFETDSGQVDMEKLMSAWKKFYKPTKIGKSLVVVPSWIDYEKKPDERILQMDPGHAFGSGTHESTAFCGALLEKYIKKDCRALDIGTGSGILAIAAVLAGAGSAVGVDIDEEAVVTARQNAEINRVGERCEFFTGDLCDRVTGKYGIITANIVADVIISLLGYIRKFMEEDGLLIVSGIIDQRRNDVISAAQENGFAVKELCEGGGWTALALE